MSHKDSEISALKSKITVKLPNLQEVNHVYFVPGMAADVSIFEYIRLPKDRFVVHTISWKIPNKNESIKAYAERMSREVKHDHCVLIGVSFGGVIVQEMNRYLSCKKLIIISSVKNKYELPKRMRLIRKTGVYKVLPTSLVSKIKNWEKFAIGDFAKKRAIMYQKYLAVNDKVYLDWAIKQMVCWEQEKAPEGLIHIHGDKDIIFPVDNIKDYILVTGGTHVMIINRARWFNTYLPEIIDGD